MRLLLRSRVALQDRGVDSFVLIADYRVITDRDYEPERRPEVAKSPKRRARSGA